MVARAATHRRAVRDAPTNASRTQLNLGCDNTFAGHDDDRRTRPRARTSTTNVDLDGAFSCARPQPGPWRDGTRAAVQNGVSSKHLLGSTFDFLSTACGQSGGPLGTALWKTGGEKSFDSAYLALVRELCVRHTPLRCCAAHQGRTSRKQKLEQKGPPGARFKISGKPRRLSRTASCLRGEPGRGHGFFPSLFPPDRRR